MTSPSAFRVDVGLAHELCARLGVPLPADADGVADLYRAWCATIPFDPIAKALAVVAGRVPPGADPADLGERFLDSGVGGTCWGHVTAFAAVLAAAGVEARVGVERMEDVGRVDFHSYVLADVGGREPWLCDLVHASGDPLPLRAGVRGNHGVLGTGIEDGGDGRRRHLYAHPGRPGRTFTYVMLSDGLDAEDVASFCEISARFSGVASNRFWYRRAPWGELVAARVEDDQPPGTLTVKVWQPDGCREEALEVDEAFARLGYGAHARALAEKAGLV